MTGMKVLALAAAVDGAIVINGVDISQLAKAGATAMLLIAVIVLYWDAGKRQLRFEAIMREAIDVMRAVKDSSDQTNRIIEKCKGHI